jgi:PPOX class probable FMN-dependent enzyme
MADRHTISSVDDLRAIVGEPAERVLMKEVPALDARAIDFIGSSPFLVLATSAANGTCDASPKGGPPGFVKVLDEQRLALPDFPGNKRFDGLQNLVERPGIALLFVVPGITETLRVNGSAHLTRDPELLEACAVEGKTPWFVADIRVEQVFSHCSKAFLRGGLWKPGSWPDPATVTSPSRSIAERAAEEERPETEIRVEVDRSYEPGLY